MWSKPAFTADDYARMESMAKADTTPGFTENLDRMEPMLYRISGGETTVTLPVVKTLDDLREERRFRRDRFEQRHA